MQFSLATFFYFPLSPSYSLLYCGPIRRSRIAPRILTSLRYSCISSVRCIDVYSVKCNRLQLALEGVVEKFMYDTTCTQAAAIPLSASGSMPLGLPYKDDNYVHGENVMKFQGLLCVFKGLQAMDRTIQSSNTGRGKRFLQNFQTNCGAHLASYSMGMRNSFPSSAMRLTTHHCLFPRLGMVVLYLQSPFVPSRRVWGQLYLLQEHAIGLRSKASDSNPYFHICAKYVRYFFLSGNLLCDKL